MSDTITKATMYGGLALAGVYAYKYATRKDNQPERRKHRQALTMGEMDKQIDAKNNAFGRKVPANLNVPFYSRHNYNRRRRPNHMW